MPNRELTATEFRALEMMVGGMTHREISFSLDLDETETNSLFDGIFDALSVSDRDGAIHTAIKNGLVKIDG